MGCDDSLMSQVNGIVDEIEAAARGTLYKDSSGNFVEIDDMDEWKGEQYRKIVEDRKKAHPHEEYQKAREDDGDDFPYGSYEEWFKDECLFDLSDEDDVEEPEPISISDYVDSQSLGDIRFEVDSSLALIGGKVLFAYGGPTIWVHDDCVCGYWGGSRHEVPLNTSARNALYDWFEEAWASVRAR